MPFFDIFASPRWSPLRMRTKVASFFFFFPRAFKQKKIKALRPKMTKIASRGGGSSLKAGPPWFEYLVIFDFFAPWYRRGREASSVKISWKNSKEKLVKYATEVAHLHRVSIQSCTQNGRLRKFNGAREIEFNFFIAWTIFMKLGTLVHHVHGYKTSQIF